MSNPDELERRAVAYAGKDFREARTVTVRPFSHYGDEEWKALDFLKMVGEAISKIPPGAISSAKVCLEEFDSGGYKLELIYQRLETPEEVQHRIDTALRHAHLGVRNERQEYLRLKAKYEGGRD
jgi:hypothetical protein